MSLFKQLNLFIVVLFFIIFTGNFIISVQNIKDFLITESVSKAQDTATSLGLTLKPLLKDKLDPEIEATIKAVANRGFFKEIRLEDIGFSFTNLQLVEASKDLVGLYWKVSNVKIDPQYGEFYSVNDDQKLIEQLAQIENEEVVAFEPTEEIHDDTHLFIPSKEVKLNDMIPISFTATHNEKNVQTNVTLKYNNTLFSDIRAEKFDSVPQWFIDLIPINLPETKSEISDGWKTTAILYVSANAGEAYEKLYNQAKSAVIYTILAFIFSIGLAFVFVKLILQPLFRIQKLANNISKGHFETIDQLPMTTELKTVSIAMNDMSTKIKGVIEKLNKNLEGMTKKLTIDSVTGLSIKQAFDTDMKNMFMSKNSGYVFSIKIDNLAEFAKEHGNDEVEKFLKAFADILVQTNANVSAYRFYGSEFAMIAKNVSYAQAVQITEKLQKELDTLAQKINKLNIAHIGATPFNKYGTTQEMLDAANEAYETAKQIGPNEAVIKDDSQLAKDMSEWRELVFDIIDNGKFSVEYINDAYSCDMQNKKLLMQEAFTKALDKKGNPIPIGTFISIAEKYDKIFDLDFKVIQKVIEHIYENKISHEISINLSLDSIKNTQFRIDLKKLLEQHAAIADKLVFSITSYGASQKIEDFKSFVNDIHTLGAKIIVKRFETKFISLEEIKKLHLDYIRLAREYTHGICQDNTKKGFVESMQDLAVLLNIKVFAESVKDDKDYEIIKNLQLYGASRN